MKLPFLKNSKLPRIAVDPPEEKLIGGSISDHVMKELMDAAHDKDVKKFRASLEALLMDYCEGDKNG